MPNKRSAMKAIRQDKKRADRNKLVFANIRDLRRHFRKAVEAKDTTKAQDLAKQITVAFDKAAQKGIIKKNTAGRKKSRMMKKLNNLGGTSTKKEATSKK